MGVLLSFRVVCRWEENEAVSGILSMMRYGITAVQDVLHPGTHKTHAHPVKSDFTIALCCGMVPVFRRVRQGPSFRSTVGGLAGLCARTPSDRSDSSCN